MIFTLDELFHSDVNQKRINAHVAYQELGSELAQLPEVKEKLSNLQTLSENLFQQMASMTMFTLCAACGQKNDGGCCSEFMSNETDTVLLLINLLLGVDVKPQRDDGFECCYLGGKGCILKVKPMFCLNYNCQQILTGNEPEVIRELEKAASAVLREQYALEQIILPKLT